MKKILFKIKSLSLNEMSFAALIVAVLAALMLPVYRLAMFTVPYYDDFYYARHVHSRVINEGMGLFSVLRGCIDCIKWEWLHEQGTYSSAFMMALIPCAWDPKQYFLGVWWIITALLIGTFVLGWTLSKYLLKANVKQRIIIGTFFSIVLSQLIYSAQQGIYWYDGAVHYTFMHGILFIAVSCWIKTLFVKNKANSIAWIVISSLMSLICAGANFISTLQGLVIVVSIIGISIILKKKVFVRLVPAAVVYMIGMGINVFAPGNDVRGAYYTDVSMGALEAIGNSFLAAFKYFWEMTGFITIVVMIMAIPILWNMIDAGKFSYRFPVLVTVFSFCIYATGFTPGFYAMGYAGLARMFCAVKYTLEILIFINEAYWLGWFKRKYSKKVAETFKYNVWFFAGCLLLAVVCFATSNNQAGNYLSYGCYYYVHTGEANNFYNEYYGWVDAMEQEASVVELEPLHWKPWFLCQSVQLSTDANAEQNKAMAWWYGKEAVYVRSDE